MFLWRPCRHMEPYRGEENMHRRGLSPWHVGEVDAGEPGEMGAEGKGRFVAVRLPRRRRGRPGMGGRIKAGRKRAEDAFACLIAVGAVPRGKVIERQRWGERAKMVRPVSPCKRCGDGRWPGFDAVVPRLR